MPTAELTTNTVLCITFFTSVVISPLIKSFKWVLPLLEQNHDCFSSGLMSKKGGKCRVFYDVNDAFSSVAVVKLGKQGAAYNEAEEVHEGRENIRAGVAGE